MRQYLDLLDNVIKTGAEKTDSTGNGTINVFDDQMRFNLQEGFSVYVIYK
jgi:thymidylate synthase